VVRPLSLRRRREFSGRWFDSRKGTATARSDADLLLEGPIGYTGPRDLVAVGSNVDVRFGPGDKCSSRNVAADRDRLMAMG
jgi:hypothetical protein